MIVFLRLEISILFNEKCNFLLFSTPFENISKVSSPSSRTGFFHVELKSVIDFLVCLFC